MTTNLYEPTDAVKKELKRRCDALRAANPKLFFWCNDGGVYLRDYAVGKDFLVYSAVMMENHYSTKDALESAYNSVLNIVQARHMLWESKRMVKRNVEAQVKEEVAA